jgi:hypothetical protein
MNYEILSIETSKKIARLEIENLRLKDKRELLEKENELLKKDLETIANELGLEGHHLEDILYEINELKEKNE